MIPSDLAEILVPLTGTLQSAQPIHGGSINTAACITGTKGTYFLKYNLASRYPGMFDAEKKGLELLASVGVNVPTIFSVVKGGEHEGLLMSYIPSSRGSGVGWSKAGVALARLHQEKSEAFGLDHNNYMGSLIQSNRRLNTFPRFFIEERLTPQIVLGVENGIITKTDQKAFEKIFEKFEPLFRDEEPCLVHGDLWGGNLLFAHDSPYFIDPAVAYSSRFADLAMTTMFGKFPDAFYDAYRSEYPYSDAEKETWDLLKLYPLLIHVNLFSASYLQETRQILNYFS